jgi:hypothetical protein
MTGWGGRLNRHGELHTRPTRSRLRVSKKTWDEWADGMQANMRLPAFRRAWELIAPSMKTEPDADRAPTAFKEFWEENRRKEPFSRDPYKDQGGKRAMLLRSLGIG